MFLMTTHMQAVDLMSEVRTTNFNHPSMVDGDNNIYVLRFDLSHDQYIYQVPV